MLSDMVQPDESFASLPDAQTLLMEAFKYHALPAARRPKVRSRLWPDHRLIWNVDDKHPWVRLDESRLEVCYNGSGHDYQFAENGLVRATKGWMQGRHYFEFTPPNGDDLDGDGFPSIGVVAADVPLKGNGELAIGGSHGRGWGYYLDNMEKVHNGEKQGGGGLSFYELDPSAYVVGLLLDIEAATLELYVDGVLQPEATHTGVTCGPDVPLYAAVEAGTLARQRLKFNFGANVPTKA